MIGEQMPHIEEQADAGQRPDSPAGLLDAGRKSGTQTLERGLTLLEIAIAENVSLAELTQRSGLPKGVAYRLTTALAARGFIAQGANGRFRGGPVILKLGALTAAQADIGALARPHLEALSRETGISAFLGRRDGDHSLHLLRTPGRERIAVTTSPGTRRLLTETGIGKALLLGDEPMEWQRLLDLSDQPGDDALSSLRAAVAAGVVLQKGPPPDSINSVAVPVRGPQGDIVAAINIAATDPYLDEELMEKLVPSVRRTAAAIETAMARSADR